MGWYCSSKSARMGLFATALAGAALLAAPIAGAQVFSTNGGISNGILYADIGSSGQLNSENVAGRLYLLDLKFNEPLLELPYKTDVGINTLGSFITVRIDGGGPPLGSTSTAKGWDIIWGDVSANGNKSATAGTWTRPPVRLGNNRLFASWQTLPGSSTTNPIPPIKVDCFVDLIHDMARYSFTITNLDTKPHTVGLRFAQPYNLPIAPINNVWGPVLFSSGRIICTTTDVTGTAIPQWWQQLPNNYGSVFNPDPTQDPSVGATLQALSNSSSANITPPDRLYFGYANFIADDPAQNDYWNTLPGDIIPDYDFCRPTVITGAATYWFPRAFSAGTSSTILFYFGRQRFTSDFSDPFAAGVSGPTTLQFDPTKPAGQQLTPSPFTISAYVTNTTSITLTNVTAVLSLPPGLALAQGQNASQNAATVAAGSEADFTWQVVPTGTTSGNQDYSVAFTAQPGSTGKVIHRTIQIPALPNPTLPTGLSMVSFPFTFNNPNPAVALGLNSFDFQLLRWDQTANQGNGAYVAVSAIQPGLGYWLFLSSGKQVNLQGANLVSPGATQSFNVPLVNGWNQIGDPFTTQVRWGDVKVLDTNQGDIDYLKPQTVDVAADINHQWILPTIYGYDRASNQYVFNTDFNTDLIPYQGYWIKALKPGLALLIPAPGTVGSKSFKRSTVAAKPGPNDWLVRLEARTAGSQDGYNFIGVAANAKDGYDLLDAEKPPAIQNHVSIGIVHPDWPAGRAATYAKDVQAATGGRKVWSLAVTTPKPNTEVTVSWPDIASVPRAYELYVVDLATGARKAMRQTSSIQVNTGDAGARALQIIAEPRTAGALRIEALNVAPTRSRTSATISFVTSQSADVQVRVLRTTGAAIRILSCRAVTAGATSLTWDYRDARGAALPAGPYLVEVRATTSDGQSARMVVPHTLLR